MDDLTYTLRVLCQRNRDGSHATQADRQRTLTLASRQLCEAGFRRMRASSLKSKHVEALLERWQAEGLSAGTIKNRLAYLRWWAEKVGRAGVIPADNGQLAVPTMLPRAAETYRRQITMGLGGDPRAALKARTILRELFGRKIRLVPQLDGGLIAHWNLHPGALLKGLGTYGSGGRILLPATVVRFSLTLEIQALRGVPVQSRIEVTGPASRLERVSDPHVRINLALQQALTGDCYELYSVYPIRMSAVPASVIGTE